jgi:hypothetical protein
VHGNHQRYHESLGNVTPAACFGRDRQSHALLAAMKKQTIEHRRLQHRKLAAWCQPQTRPALRHFLI